MTCVGTGQHAITCVKIPPVYGFRQKIIHVDVWMCVICRCFTSGERLISNLYLLCTHIIFYSSFLMWKKPHVIKFQHTYNKDLINIQDLLSTQCSVGKTFSESQVQYCIWPLGIAARLNSLYVLWKSTFLSLEVLIYTSTLLCDVMCCLTASASISRGAAEIFGLMWG